VGSGSNSIEVVLEKVVAGLGAPGNALVCVVDASPGADVSGFPIFIRP